MFFSPGRMNVKHNVFSFTELCHEMFSGLVTWCHTVLEICCIKRRLLFQRQEVQMCVTCSWEMLSKLTYVSKRCLKCEKWQHMLRTVLEKLSLNVFSPFFLKDDVVSCSYKCCILCCPLLLLYDVCHKHKLLSNIQIIRYLLVEATKDWTN